MTITWHDPYEQNDNWWLHVEGLTPRAINAAYAHEVARGSFVFPHPGTGKAHLNMDSALVKRYGAVHCVWLIREDVLDNSEQFHPLSANWETAITMALIPDAKPPTLKFDDDQSFGNIRWNIRFNGKTGYDDDSYFGHITWPIA